MRIGFAAARIVVFMVTSSIIFLGYFEFTVAAKRFICS